MAKVATRVQTGDVIDITAPADYNGGDPIDFGARVGIASTGVLAGELVGLQVEGVFAFSAVDADTIALGDKVYLDEAGGRTQVTTSDASGSNKVVGYAATEKAGGVAGIVNVKLGG